MKTTLKKIQTKDGLELVGLLYEPEQQTNKILVHIHGMSGNFYENGFISFLAETLTNSGIAFFAFNNRGCELMKYLARNKDGQRKHELIGVAFEKFEECVFDIQVGIDFAASQGFAEIHLSGHSLGSPKVAYYWSQTKDERLKSVIFLSPADMIGLAKQEKDYNQDMKIASDMIASGRGGELMPKKVWDYYYLSAQTFHDLSAENTPADIFKLYDPSNKLETFNSVNISAMVVMGRKDDALTVPIEQLMERMKGALISSPKVECNILGDADHGFLNYEQQLADVINNWIQRI